MSNSEAVETTAKKAAKPKVQAAEKESAAKEPMMYVGPTIPGVAVQNTVYTEKPEALEEAQKECPYLAIL